MMVPTIKYNDTLDSYSKHKYGSFSLFVDKSFSKNEAPIIETLLFKLDHISGCGNIQAWMRSADKRCARELTIQI